MTDLTLDQEYVRRFPTSERLYAEARQIIPAGINHDQRRLEPFPVYVARAQGSHKWDVDGHELIDMWMGHGALLLGHNHPAVVAAMAEGLARGTHLGACHELELEWARLVRRLLPGADKVRFVGSGTEATLLATRLARAYTDRPKILKFHGHFHGWNDYATVGTRPPYDAPISAGVPAGVTGSVVALPPNDLAAVEAALAQGDVAAVILEPGGGSNGRVPNRPGFLRGVRDLSTRFGAQLIFDEVITGFRVAPGGIQGLTGITPDLTALGKVVAGGLPGGAVVGKAPVMDMLEFRDAQFNRYGRVLHQGTFNASPVVAAAAIATLQIVEKGEVQERANRLGAVLRAGMNAVLREEGAPGLVYGAHSIVRLFLGKDAPPPGPDDGIDGAWPADKLMAGMGPLGYRLRRAWFVHDVDFPTDGGWLSAVHTDDDLRAIVAAFAGTVRRLKQEGAFA